MMIRYHRLVVGASTFGIPLIANNMFKSENSQRWEKFKRFSPDLIRPAVLCDVAIDSSTKLYDIRGIIESKSIPLQITPQMEENVKLLKKKTSFSEFFKLQLKLFSRSIYLGILLVPSVIMGGLMYAFPKRFSKCWKWIFASISAAGPCWIKLMQWIATREDLFSPAICEKASEFHASVPSHSFDHTVHVLSNEFGVDWRLLFPTLNKDSKILGSGCIAQVYKTDIDVERANLYNMKCVLNNQTEFTEDELKFQQEHFNRLRAISNDKGHAPIALKVEHPGIETEIELDLTLMKALASFIDKFIPNGSWLGLPDAVSQFEHSMTQQTNLTIEGFNIRDLDKNLRNGETSSFIRSILMGSASKGRCIMPTVAISSPRVLAMTVEEGVNASEWADFHHKEDSGVSKVQKKQVAALLMGSFLQMLFRDNVVHADLHPGNVLVRPAISDGESNENNHRGYFDIVLLDSGLVARLSEKDRNNFRELFTAVVLGKGNDAGRMILERAPKQKCENPDAFCKETDELIQLVFKRSGGVKSGKVHMSHILLKMLRLACYHKVQLDSNFVTVVMSVVVVEGLAKKLDPDIDLLKTAAKIILLDGKCV